ncbi:hypothetical protein [Yoonia sp. BS5-3]|uniref:Alpha/beta fold hydrolase n=1 Tax=Yoonia phaeophyticola TaxID=3137369 RepID=A0ABZ2VBV3_9RHOB
MKIVVLPGLDGTGRLIPKLQDALYGGHSVTVFSYPHHLFRYEDILEWILPRLPREDYILVAESFSGPVAVLVGAQNPLGLKGIVFIATFARKPRKLPAFHANLIEILRSSLRS